LRGKTGILHAPQKPLPRLEIGLGKGNPVNSGPDLAELREATQIGEEALAIYAKHCVAFLLSYRVLDFMPRPCAGHPRLSLLQDVEGRDKHGHDGTAAARGAK
jgi:hypothetical protein